MSCAIETEWHTALICYLNELASFTDKRVSLLRGFIVLFLWQAFPGGRLMRTREIDSKLVSSNSSPNPFIAQGLQVPYLRTLYI